MHKSIQRSRLFATAFIEPFILQRCGPPTKREASVIPLLKDVGQRGEVLDGRNECLAMKWHLNPSDIISALMPLPHGD